MLHVLFQKPDRNLVFFCKEIRQSAGNLIMHEAKN